jgi:polyamine oxidase
MLFAGIDSANILINRIFKNEEYKVRGKYEYDDLIAKVKYQ